MPDIHELGCAGKRAKQANYIQGLRVSSTRRLSATDVFQWVRCFASIAHVVEKPLMYDDSKRMFCREEEAEALGRNMQGSMS